MIFTRKQEYALKARRLEELIKSLEKVMTSIERGDRASEIAEKLNKHVHAVQSSFWSFSEDTTEVDVHKSDYIDSKVEEEYALRGRQLRKLIERLKEVVSSIQRDDPESEIAEKLSDDISTVQYLLWSFNEDTGINRHTEYRGLAKQEQQGKIKFEKKQEAGESVVLISIKDSSNREVASIELNTANLGEALSGTEEQPVSFRFSQ